MEHNTYHQNIDNLKTYLGVARCGVCESDDTLDANETRLGVF